MQTNTKITSSNGSKQRKIVKKPAQHSASMVVDPQIQRNISLTNVNVMPSSQTMYPRNQRLKGEELDQINEADQLEYKMSSKAAAIVTKYESARASNAFKIQRIRDILGEEVQQIYNYGYLHSLGCTFWSTDQQIHHNYRSLVKQYSSFLEAGDTQYSVDLKRVLTSYQVLKTEGRRNSYLHALKIRCFLSQPLSFEQLRFQEQNGKKAFFEEYSYESVFPFFIFPIKIKKIKDQQKDRLLEINFIQRAISQQVRNQPKKYTHFKSLKQAIPGHKPDQLVLQLDGRAPLEIKAVLPSQRDLIVKILRLAIQDYYENQIVPLLYASKLRKPKSRKNSPKPLDASFERKSSPSKESKGQFTSKGTTEDWSLLRSKSSKSDLLPPSRPCQSGIKLLRDDYVIPQKSLDDEAHEIVDVIPLIAPRHSEEIMQRSIDDSKVTHPSQGRVVISLNQRSYELILENDMEAGYVYDKVREVLEGAHARQKVSELIAKQEAADEAPALKVEELALVEDEYADVRRRLELLIIKRNELKRELKLRKDTEDQFQYLQTEESRLNTLNRSGDNNFITQDQTLRRYGLDLLSPKALDRVKEEADREIVLTQNSYGEQLVIKRDTVQNLKKAFSSPQKYKPKSSSPKLGHDYSFADQN